MSYKITYFDIKGRAECIRLLFSAAGVKFEDELVKHEDWSQFQSSTPWNQLPYIDIDGKRLAQATAICRYIARKYDLCGENEWESAKCDEYVDASNELIEEWVGFTFYEKDEARKAQRKETFTSTTIPKCLVKFEAIKEKNGGDFLVGKKLTWADVSVADKLQVFQDDINADVLTAFPNLEKFKNAVFSVPKIKEYIERTGYTYKKVD